MPTAVSIRAWGLVHKWTSLVCTVFLLFLCLTGLPLIFREEIDDVLSPRPHSSETVPVENISLDEVIASAIIRFPGNVCRGSCSGKTIIPTRYDWLLRRR